MFLMLITINIILFLFNNILGSTMLLVACLFFLFTKRGGNLEKILYTMIYSLPFFYQGILNFNDNISITTILVTIFVAYGFISILYKGLKIDSFFLFLAIVSIGFILISIINSLNPLESFLFMFKLILFILVVFVSRTFKINGATLNNHSINILTKRLIDVCVGLSIGIIVQYIFYHYLGKTIGSIFFGDSREIFNLYFLQKSILSGFLCMGGYLLVCQLFEKINSKSIFMLIVILLANVINTSRTGLICLLITIVLYILLSKNHENKKVNVYVTIIFIIGMFIVLIPALEKMRDNITGFLDDNGRFEIFIDSFPIIKDNFLLGIGSSWEDLFNNGLTIEIHNFILQYLLTFGIFGLLGFCILLILSLKKTNNIKLKFGMIYLIFCGQLFTYWHNSLYIIPIFILGLLSEKEILNKIKRKD